ncbi:MAG TPA: hypothetical protein VH008_07090, partial [Pseudonocardia sp.]|nr:hypothetical protein [Pseudonocardia sp.]
MRLAVELGGAAVRLASADGRGEDPGLVPSSSADSAAAAVRTALRRFDSAADRVEELVVAYPAHWSERAARTAAEWLTAPGLPVRVCSSAVAAARELAARATPPPGPLAVLQVAPAGSCATVLAGPDGPPVAVRYVARSSGNHPLWVLAEAAADAGIPPCELTGGTLLIAERAVAEQLAEPLADLLGERPAVPADADSLAVLGALRPEPEPAAPDPVASESPPARPTEGHPPLAAGLWPPAPPYLRARSAFRNTTGPVLAALIAAALTYLGSGIGANALRRPRAGRRPRGRDEPGAVRLHGVAAGRLASHWRPAGAAAHAAHPGRRARRVGPDRHRADAARVRQRGRAGPGVPRAARPVRAGRRRRFGADRVH